jgi:hypothetical protein
MIPQHQPNTFARPAKSGTEVTYRSLRGDGHNSSEEGEDGADVRPKPQQTMTAPRDNSREKRLERPQLIPLTIGRNARSSISSASEATAVQSPTTSIGSPATAKSKKRHSSLFNFLSVKEPSKRALEDYEAQLKKDKGRGPVTPAGMAMVSSQKLPAHVPKVNSKWDGVPDEVKRRQKRHTRSGSLVSGSRGDDASSVMTNSTGFFSNYRRGGRSWNSVFGGKDVPEPRQSESRTSSQRQVPAQSNTSLPRTASSSTSFGFHRPFTKEGTGARPNSRTHNPIVRSPSMNFRPPPPDLSESTSSSPAYRSPETPPPLPPSFLDNGSGSKYPNPSLHPKNSDGSLMQTHQEHVSGTQSAQPPEIHIQSSGPDILPPPTPVSRRRLHAQPSAEFGSRSSSEATPQSILKKRGPRMPTPSPSTTSTPSQSPINLRVHDLAVRPSKSSLFPTEDPAMQHEKGEDPSASHQTPPKGKKLKMKLTSLFPREKTHE